MAGGAAVNGGLLVIGMGNPFRTDDGIGHHVARAIAEGREDTELVEVMQLDIALLERIAGAREVVFADASVEPEGGAVQLRAVVPRARPMVHAHTLSPEGLLHLARGLGYRVPPAWLVTVQATDLGLADTPSDACLHLVPEAARTALAVLETGTR